MNKLGSIQSDSLLDMATCQINDKDNSSAPYINSLIPESQQYTELYTAHSESYMTVTVPSEGNIADLEKYFSNPSRNLISFLGEDYSYNKDINLIIKDIETKLGIIYDKDFSNTVFEASPEEVEKTLEITNSYLQDTQIKQAKSRYFRILSFSKIIVKNSTNKHI